MNKALIIGIPLVIAAVMAGYFLIQPQLIRCGSPADFTLMRQVVVTLHAWQLDHQGQYPDTLKDLIDQNYILKTERELVELISRSDLRYFKPSTSTPYDAILLELPSKERAGVSFIYRVGGDGLIKKKKAEQGS